MHKILLLCMALFFFLSPPLGQKALADWTIDVTAPTCAINFIPTSPQPAGTSITVTVDNSPADTSGIQSITLFRKLGTGTETQVASNANLSSLDYNWSTSTTGTYTFRAVMVDKAGNTGSCDNSGSPYEISCPTNMNLTLQTPPNNSTIMISSDTLQNFTWSSVAQAVAYLFRLDANPISWSDNCSALNTGDSCGEPLTNSTSATISPNNSSYRWWVQAMDVNGCEGPASVGNFSVVTPTPTAAPTPTPGAWLKTSGGDVHANN